MSSPWSSRARVEIRCILSGPAIEQARVDGVNTQATSAPPGCLIYSLPMVFWGEEISDRHQGVDARATYAPQASVLFHEYAQHNSRRHNVPKFWEQTKHRGAGRKSLQRLTALMEWQLLIGPHEGVGVRSRSMAERPVELFYKWC